MEPLVLWMRGFAAHSFFRCRLHPISLLGITSLWHRKHRSAFLLPLTAKKLLFIVGEQRLYLRLRSEFILFLCAFEPLDVAFAFSASVFLSVQGLRFQSPLLTIDHSCFSFR